MFVNQVLLVALPRQIRQNLIHQNARKGVIRKNDSRGVWKIVLSGIAPD
jgi:hypothetical protein